MMRSKKIEKILHNHQKWLIGNGGEMANLHDTNLREANLCEVNLRGADLSRADLRGADLYGADLRGANLCEADLRWANLRRANLRLANLRGANLISYDDLSEVDLINCIIPHYEIPEGDLIVYKKVRNQMVCLLIPRHISRTISLVGRKCRSQAAYVIAIEGDKSVMSKEGIIYTMGEWVYPDCYDPDPRFECKNGIYFFLTRAEAENE